MAHRQLLAGKLESSSERKQRKHSQKGEDSYNQDGQGFSTTTAVAMAVYEIARMLPREKAAAMIRFFRPPMTMPD